jgi:hypothetical protein
MTFEEDLEKVEQKINKYALAMHHFRLVPRLLTVGYAWMVWDTVQWFQGITDPSTQQAALLSVVVGMSGAIFGLYTSSTSGVNK